MATLAARLDDGSTATIRIREATSRQQGHLQGDDYVLDIAVPAGAPVQIPLWASYGRLAVALADLVNGAGDEILVVSQHGRGSPLFAPVLQVWSISRGQTQRIGEFQVGGFIDTCAWWRDKVVVLEGEKPRSVRLDREVESSGCPESADVKSALHAPGRDLRWSAASGRFEAVEKGSGR